MLLRIFFLISYGLFGVRFLFSQTFYSCNFSSFMNFLYPLVHSYTSFLISTKASKLNMIETAVLKSPTRHSISIRSTSKGFVAQAAAKQMMKRYTCKTALRFVKY